MRSGTHEFEARSSGVRSSSVGSSDVRSSDARRVLFLAQLPPPVHGVTIMSKHIHDEFAATPNVAVEHVWQGSARSLHDINKRSIGKYLSFAALLLALARRWLGGERYEIAYLTLAPWTHAVLRDALLAGMARLLSARALVHLHGEGLADVLTGTGIKQRILRQLLWRTELLTATKEAAGVAARSGLFSRVLELPNMVADPQTWPQPRSQSGPQSGPQPQTTSSDKIRCGFLANLDPRKGVLRFIDAMEAMAKAGLPVTGTIAGPSTNWLTVAQVEALVAERGLDKQVTVTGPIFGAYKDQFWRNLDVLIYLSEHDHAPLVVIEALAYGVVPITLATGGIAGMLGEGLAGNVLGRDLAPVDVVAATVCKVRDYAASAARLESDKQKSRARYLAEFTEPVFHDRLKAILGI